MFKHNLNGGVGVMVSGGSIRVSAVRAFNRFYTRQVGALDKSLLKSRYTLTEVRVLYELAQNKQSISSNISQALKLDAGYLSRILRKFQAQGLLDRQRSDKDGRREFLTLTSAGRKLFADLNRRASKDVATMLGSLDSASQQRIVNSMALIRRLLEGASTSSARDIVLRPHRPGDIGWAIERHGTLYFDEFGWNEQFEALVAEILGKFVRDLDPRAERCWIAEVGGERVGCVFLVRNAEDRDFAQLRCLLVEPHARGFGVGQRLVSECITFARAVGYRKMMLWTNDVLASARRIYEAAGFKLIGEEQHRSFGHDLVGQTWERDL
jgi:DNA-binding MarR family transcriptional regulator/GNAT superfamily N-acetyltransferase